MAFMQKDASQLFRWPRLEFITPAMRDAIRTFFALVAAIVGALVIGIGLLAFFASRVLPEIDFGFGSLVIPVVAWRVLKSRTSNGLRVAVTLALSAPLTIYAVSMGLATLTDPALAEARGNAPFVLDVTAFHPLVLITFYLPALAFIATTAWCGMRKQWGLLCSIILLAPVLGFALLITMWLCAVVAALSG